MAESYYIRVPLDDLEQPHWRCLEAEVGGDTAIVFALRLRGMAAKSNQGGLVTTHTGAPMMLSGVATYLGYTIQQIQRSLDLLHAHGLATLGEDEAGGIRIIDPVLDAHFRRVSPSSPALALPPKTNHRQKYSRPLTPAERQRFRRSGQLPNGVHVLDTLHHASRHALCHVTSCDVTHPLQHADYTLFNSCHVTQSTSMSMSTSNSSTVTPAAANLPSSPAPSIQLSRETEAAISLLPAAHQYAVREVCYFSSAPPDILLSNVLLLCTRMAAKKGEGIANPAGWLRQALREDFGAPQRISTAEDQARSEKAKKAKQQAETDAEDTRRAELARQAQLLRYVDDLDTDIRAEIINEAEERYRQLGGTTEQVWRACLAAVVEDRLISGQAA